MAIKIGLYKRPALGVWRLLSPQITLRGADHEDQQRTKGIRFTVRQFRRKTGKSRAEKNATVFLALILGALLTIAKRRSVTQWLKAAQISDDFRQAFYHIPNVGRKSENLFDEMIELVLQQLSKVIMASSKIRSVLDDSPTKRYGKKIEGAGYHHIPTPGRTNAKTCFGHSWVVAALGAVNKQPVRH